MKIIEILATLFTITGFYLISENMLLTGFSISLMANIFWLVWSTDNDAKGIFLVNSLLAISAVNGLLGAW